MCTAPGFQDFPYLCDDGHGGILVAWEDSRAGSHPHAQHIRSDGTPDPVWAVNGAAVCLAEDSSQWPHYIVPDGVDGAYVPIVKRPQIESTSYDFYLLRLGPDSYVVSVDGTPSGGPSGLDLEAIAPNPSTGPGFNVTISLPDARPARLEVLDISGRLLDRKDLGDSGPGRHRTVRCENTRLAAGLYLVRLSQGSVARTARAVRVR